MRELHLRHLERVPFENLDIARGIPIRLEEEALLAKLLGGRGGFCYELNGAFAWLLEQLGYSVQLLEARVARPDGTFGIPYDHLTLRVELERSYLADVGFGDGFVQPLPLDTGALSIQGDEAFRIRTLEAGLNLERRSLGATWSPQYRFMLEPKRLSDFEPGCRHHQTSATSAFTKGPLITRLTSRGRVTLHRDRLERPDETIPVESTAAWAAHLEAQFGIRL